MKEHLMKLARDASLEADYSGNGRPRIGCVVAYKGCMIAKGCNSDKTHTEQDVYNVYRFKKAKNYLPPKVHAEIAALNKIKFLDVDFSKIEVYIYRELRDGSRAMARPCPACMQKIKDMGVKKIHYTTPEGIATEVFKKEN